MKGTPSRHGGESVVLRTLPYTNGSVDDVVTAYAGLVECATSYIRGVVQRMAGCDRRVTS